MATKYFHFHTTGSGNLNSTTALCATTTMDDEHINRIARHAAPGQGQERRVIHNLVPFAKSDGLLFIEMGILKGLMPFTNANRFYQGAVVAKLIRIWAEKMECRVPTIQEARGLGEELKETVRQDLREIVNTVNRLDYEGIRQILVMIIRPGLIHLTGLTGDYASLLCHEDYDGVDYDVTVVATDRILRSFQSHEHLPPAEHPWMMKSQAANNILANYISPHLKGIVDVN